MYITEEILILGGIAMMFDIEGIKRGETREKFVKKPADDGIDISLIKNVSLEALIEMNKEKREKEALDRAKQQLRDLMGDRC